MLKWLLDGFQMIYLIDNVEQYLDSEQEWFNSDKGPIDSAELPLLSSRDAY